MCATRILKKSFRFQPKLNREFNFTSAFLADKGNFVRFFFHRLVYFVAVIFENKIIIIENEPPNIHSAHTHTGTHMQKYSS